MTEDKQNILLTGATGTIGSWLMRHYSTQTEKRVYVLVRDRGRQSAEMRVARALGLEDPSEIPSDRILILRGDIRRVGFGLDKQDYHRIADQPMMVIHGAATTRLGDSEENCRRINLEGTLHVLDYCRDLKKRGLLKRLSHVSTAYVAGNRLSTALKEDDLPANPDFSNHYERSKYLAEVSVRKEISEGLPATIFRPSIVVGDSTTGRPSSFNVLYPFTRILLNGALSQVPVEIDGRMNLVPIDFVVRCIASISEADASLGKTYHLVSRVPQRFRMLMDLRYRYPHFEHLFARIRLVDPAAFDPSQLSEDELPIYEGISSYLPYLSDHVDFDTANMDSILPGIGVTWPETGMPFLCKLFEYVIQVGYIRTD